MGVVYRERMQIFFENIRQFLFVPLRMKLRLNNQSDPIDLRVATKMSIQYTQSIVYRIMSLSLFILCMCITYRQTVAILRVRATFSFEFACAACTFR